MFIMTLHFDLGSRRAGILVPVRYIPNLSSCFCSHYPAARCTSSANTIYKLIGIFRTFCLILNNLHLVFFWFLLVCFFVFLFFICFIAVSFIFVLTV
jgi:hypothetical protein